MIVVRFVAWFIFGVIVINALGAVMHNLTLALLLSLPVAVAVGRGVERRRNRLGRQRPERLS